MHTLSRGLYAQWRLRDLAIGGGGGEAFSRFRLCLEEQKVCWKEDQKAEAMQCVVNECKSLAPLKETPTELWVEF